MDKWLYVMQLLKGENYRKMTMEVVNRHVDNLRRLDEEGDLEMCGVYKGFPNVAGMIILRADSLAEAKKLCKREPLVAEGFATYTVHALQVADKENNFLL